MTLKHEGNLFQQQQQNSQTLNFQVFSLFHCISSAVSSDNTDNSLTHAWTYNKKNTWFFDVVRISIQFLEIGEFQEKEIFQLTSFNSHCQAAHIFFSSSFRFTSYHRMTSKYVQWKKTSAIQIASVFFGFLFSCHLPTSLLYFNCLEIIIIFLFVFWFNIRVTKQFRSVKINGRLGTTSDLSAGKPQAKIHWAS